MMKDDKEHWSVDKRIPIALIITIGFQTGAGVWWASSMSERVTVLEKRADSVAPQGERITRVEVKLDNVIENLTEIKQLLRRPEDRR